MKPVLLENNVLLHFEEFSGNKLLFTHNKVVHNRKNSSL